MGSRGAGSPLSSSKPCQFPDAPPSAALSSALAGGARGAAAFLFSSQRKRFGRQLTPGGRKVPRPVPHVLHGRSMVMSLCSLCRGPRNELHILRSSAARPSRGRVVFPLDGIASGPTCSDPRPKGVGQGLGAERRCGEPCVRALLFNGLLLGFGPMARPLVLRLAVPAGCRSDCRVLLPPRLLSPDLTRFPMPPFLRSRANFLLQ